jgi:hypothetical protein
MISCKGEGWTGKKYAKLAYFLAISGNYGVQKGRAHLGYNFGQWTEIVGQNHTYTWHHLPALICGFFGKKNNFDQENFYVKETIEQVPEKPL